MKCKYLLLGLLSLCACTNDMDEQVEQVEPSEITEVTMTLNGFECDKQSRTSLEITPDGAVFTWAKNDTVGVFPDRGLQSDFPIQDGVGSTKASFNGGGWALKPSSKYAAYFPFIKSVDFDKTCVPANYLGQTQKGNGSTAHIGAYDYNASVATTPTQGKVNFDFKHLGVLVQLSMKLPEGTYKSLSFSSTEAVFAGKGSFDLTKNPVQMTPDPKSLYNVFTINLEDIVVKQGAEEVKIYFMCPPVDLTGKTLKVSVKSKVATVRGDLTIQKPWKAGHFYALSLNQFENQWVDLGLPSGTLWADHNVGAVYPEDWGAFFAWGSTERILPNSEPTSFFGTGVPESITDISGDPEYDVARKYWGDPARIPTYDEIQELQAQCKWTWNALKGGYDVKSLKEGNKNSIYLPAAGYMANGTTFTYEKSKPEGFYWSSTRNGTYAYSLWIYKDGHSIQSYLHPNGLSIRPVCSKPAK